MLTWNHYEFIECLAVLPEIEQYDTSHTFEVVKDGLRLVLTIFQCDGDVYFDLFREGIEDAVLKLRLIDCPGARYVATKPGKEYLWSSPYRRALVIVMTVSRQSRWECEYL